MGTVGTGNHLAAEVLRLTRLFVPFDLGGVHVLEVRLTVFVCERPHEGGYVRPLAVKARHEGLYLLGLNERFVTLYVDDHGVAVVLCTPGGCRDSFVCLEATVGAALMVRACHDYLAAERLYGIVDTFVIGGYDHGLQGFGGLFIDTVNDGLVTDVG